MIDISDKEAVLRVAIAEGEIELKKDTVEKIMANSIEKGNVVECAKIAGIIAVKNTHNIIPHCHQIPLTYANISINILHDKVKCSCEVKAEYKTGVEIDALVGVTTALLTIWDMVKKYEKDEKGMYPNVKINNIRVVKKLKH